MPYSDITTGDRNGLKRWVQRRRLDDAVRAARAARGPERAGRVLDYGGGDGSLCRRILAAWPAADIECFEPTPVMRREAEEALRGSSIRVSGEIDPEVRYDLVFCCELFEHLPDAEITSSLANLHTLLAVDGVLVIGVPNEIFAAAAVKGCFRMTRRYGEYDARPATVFAASVGRPRRDRPEQQLDGLPFIYPHVGFDHRDLIARLSASGFAVRALVGSPFPHLPIACNSEVYLVCEHGRVNARRAPSGRHTR